MCTPILAVDVEKALVCVVGVELRSCVKELVRSEERANGVVVRVDDAKVVDVFDKNVRRRNAEFIETSKIKVVIGPSLCDGANVCWVIE